MKRSTIFALLLSAACSTTAFAQKPATKTDARSDSALKQLFGTWEGAVYSDHAPEMTMRMSFVKSDSVQVTVSIMLHDQDFVTGPVSNFKFDGTGFSLNVGMMNQSCAGSGVLIDGALKGAFNCGMGGVTYLAKKK